MKREKQLKNWIYGLNPVLEAIRSGRDVKSVFVSSSRKEKTSDIEKEISASGITLKKTDNLFFDSRFPKGHQGIAAIVSPREYADLEDLLKIPSAKNELALFLVIDCLEDPRNLGAVLRVADAGGVHGVIMQEYRSATLSPEAVKTSAGASEYVPISVVPNIKHAIKEIKDIGLVIIGAEAGQGMAIWDLDLSMPLSVVIGSEDKGLRKTVRENCDFLVSLPMKGKINSLNVSVATGVIVFEIMRQRTYKKLV